MFKLALPCATTTSRRALTTERCRTSRAPSSFCRTSSSPGNYPTHLHPPISLPNFCLCAPSLSCRYAEIVNVKLGNGQVRKGQVLEIAGKKAVVQVSLIRGKRLD